MGSVKNTLGGREKEREREREKKKNGERAELKTEKSHLSLCILSYCRISLAFNNIYLPVIAIV